MPTKVDGSRTKERIHGKIRLYRRGFIFLNAIKKPFPLSVCYQRTSIFLAPTTHTFVYRHTMSSSFEDLLRQEKYTECQSSSDAPCPSSLIAAASMIKGILVAADVERKQESYRGAEKKPREGADEKEEEERRRLCAQVAGATMMAAEASREIDAAIAMQKTEAAATLAATAAAAAAAGHVHSKVQYLGRHGHDYDCHVHSEQQQHHQQHQQQQQNQKQHQFSKTSSAHTFPRGVPLRRPGRPPRKSVHVNTSSGAELLRLASAGLGELTAATERARAEATSHNVDHYRAAKEDKRLSWDAQQGTNASAASSAPAFPASLSAPSFPASSSALSFPASSSAPAFPASSSDPAFASASASSAFARRRYVRPALSHPPSFLCNSTTRLLSSETYLRRLFVTASLAHVLSLDECIPRRILPALRAASSRASNGGRGGGDGQREGREEEAGKRDKRDEERGGEQGEKRWNGDDDTGPGWKKTEDEAPATTTKQGTGPFQKVFPVTLIDSADRRWSVTYVTNRRANLLSGRLADGWESFCSAHKLKIGDEVEFTRVEAAAAQEQVQHGRNHGQGKEAIARVTVRKKRERNR